MAMAQSQQWCELCGGYTLHARTYFGSGWGCLLTILSGGLFLPIWILIGIIEFFTSRWRCQICGQVK
jgi:hypothetical protein